MITIYDRDLKAVRRSRNLRGIIEYPSSVERVDVWTSQLGVTWTDGSSTIIDFADHGVLLDWIKARRMFRGVPIIHY